MPIFRNIGGNVMRTGAVGRWTADSFTATYGMGAFVPFRIVVGGFHPTGKGKYPKALKEHDV